MKKIKRIFVLFTLIAGIGIINNQVKAQQLLIPLVTIKTGSYIINMGVVPQTVDNALKPYGLVYDLIRNYYVPVRWVISPTKPKDGADFTYSGTPFKGGTFIIQKIFITPAVAARIAYWESLGVVGVYTTYNFNVNVTRTLYSAPIWALDAQNGHIAEQFLLNAGINNTDFPDAYNWKTPDQLDECTDIYVMPHADPTWAEHSNLYYWNRDYRGAIWGGCHAVSVLENMNNGLAPSDPNYIQTNFLSTNGLIPFHDHHNGTPPYTQREWTFPVGQYMGVTDAAMTNGSEQIFIPDLANGSLWRPTTKIFAYDPTQQDVTTLNPDLSNAAAVILRGYAYGDSTRGVVCYEAGHNINNNSVGSVAAQRVFFDFSYLQTFEKAPMVVSINYDPGTGPIPLPYEIVVPPTSYALSATITSPIGAGPFTYLWSVNKGSFSDADTTIKTSTSETPVYYPPVITSVTDILLLCVVKDKCGRQSVGATTASSNYTLVPAPQPPTAIDDNAVIQGTCLHPGTYTIIFVLNNDSDPDGDPLHVTNVTGTDGTWITNGTTVTFYPSTNFVGTANATYMVCDNESPVNLCSTANISVGVGTPDGNGCYPGMVYDVQESNFITLANFIDQNGTGAALNDTSLDFVENAYIAVNDGYLDFGTAVGDYLIMSIGKTLREKDSIELYWSKSGDNTATISIEIGQSSTGPWTDAATFSLAGNGYGPGVSIVSTYTLPAGSSGITYVRINAGTYPSTNSLQDVWLDAVEYEYLNCVPADPVANNDILIMYEDNPARFSPIANDDNPDNVSLKLIIISPPVHGTVSLNPDNTITYVNTTDYPGGAGNGTDSLTYQIINAQGLAATATVHIIIMNDNCSAGNYAPLDYGSPLTVTFQEPTSGIVSDSYLNQASPTTNYGNTNTFLLGLKSPNDDRPVIRFNGVTTIIPSNAIIQNAVFSMYCSNSNITGKTMAVKIFSLTQSWTETGTTWTKRDAVPTPWTDAGGTYNPAFASFNKAMTTAKNEWKNFDITNLVQQWVNDSVVNNGIIVRRNYENLNAYLLTFVSSEGNGALRPKLVVTYVTPLACAAIPNRPPMANPDSTKTLSSTAKTIAVLSTDSDPDGNALSVAGIFDGPSVAQGTAIISGPNIIFTPNPAFVGTSTFKYIVQDNGVGNLTDTSVVTVHVNNSPPRANPDYITVTSNSVNYPINVQANDVNPDGPNPWTTTLTVQANHGFASVSGINILYTPDWGYTGKDTLIYELCEPPDPTACIPITQCDTARVIITIGNQPPIAVDDTITILPCLPYVIFLIDNDIDPEGDALTVTIVSGPVPGGAGTLVNNHDGTVTFTPAVGFSGTVTYTYTITDNGIPPLTSPPATLTIHVSLPVINTAPVAVTDVWYQNMDQTDYISVLDNDYDAENNPLTNPVITVAPAHGIATVLMNGTIKYIPNPGFFGTDQLIYRICDIIFNPAICDTTTGLCDTARLILNVAAPQMVEAIPDQASTWQDINVSGNVLTNDFDPVDNLTLTFDGFFDKFGVKHYNGTINVYSLDGLTLAGVLTISTNGSYIFDPTPTFTGSVVIPYQIHHNYLYNVIGVASLQITVNPLPQGTNSVIANNDEAVSYGAAVSGNLLGNDSDPQGNTFVITSFLYDHDGLASTPLVAGTLGTTATIGGVTTAGHATTNAGMLTVQANGVYSFTPLGDFHGSITASYTICDNGSPVACSMAMISIVVIPDINGAGNDKPFAGDDFIFTQINTAANGNFISNDKDANGNSLILNGTTINILGPHTAIGTPVGTVAGGTVQYYADGTYLYNPPSDLVGPDNVIYQICDNGAPSICAKATIDLLVGGTADISIVKTAFPSPAIAGQQLTYTLTVTNTGPGGAVNINIRDTISAFPSPQYALNLAGPWFAWPGTSPVSNLDINQSSNIYIRGTLSINQCTAVYNKAWVTSTTPDVNLINNNSSVTTVVLDQTNPTINCPADVSVTANAATCTATGVVLGNPLATNDNCTVSTVTNNGIATYPLGNTIVTWKVTDASGNSATCNQTVHVNGIPQAVTDVNMTNEDTPVSGNVMTNDLGLCDNPVTVTGHTNPANGTLIINANGSYTYTPNSNYNGFDSFTYTLCDANGDCSTTTVTITINAVNDPPVALGNQAVTIEDIPVVLPAIQNNDTDIDGVVQVSTIDLDPTTPGQQTTVTTAQGIWTVNTTTGNVTFTPALNFNGTATQIYSICDNGTPLPALCDTAILTVLVNPANDPPVVNDTVAITPEDIPITICLPIIDLDGPQPFIISAAGCYTNGTVTYIVIGTNACVTYTPDPDFNGLDTVCITVCDGAGACDNANIFITVLPLNDPPVVNDTSVSLPEDGTITVCLPITDIDGTQPFTISNIGCYTNGTVTYVVNGTFACVTYTPYPDFNGLDTICLTVCDSAGACDNANVFITVFPLNDPPVVPDSSASIPQDSTVTICLPIADIDGPQPYNAILGCYENGTVTFEVIGNEVCITYTPDSTFTGLDTICVTVCDNDGACDTALLIINVYPYDPVIGLAKVASTPVVLSNHTYDIQYKIIVQNLGNVALANIVVTDDLTGTFPFPSTFTIVSPPVATGSLNANAAYNGNSDVDLLLAGSTLAIGITDTITFMVNVVANGNFGPFANLAIGIGEDPNGETTIDTSTTGVITDPNENGDPNEPGENEPTIVILIQDPAIGLAKSVVSAILKPDGSFDVTFKIIAENLGNEALEHIQITDDLSLAFPLPATFTVPGAPVASGTLEANLAYNGTSDINLLNSTISHLNIGQSAFVVFMVNVKINSPLPVTFYNFSVGNAIGDSSGIIVSDTSNEGTITDPNGNGDANEPGENGATAFDLTPVGLDIPAGFSPDFDGINDYFAITGIENYPDCELTVYNRWGNKIYYMRGYDNTWNGKPNDNSLLTGKEKVPSGTYYYILVLHSNSLPDMYGYIVIKY